MSLPHDTSIFARSQALDDGERVRLRLARRSDEPAIGRFLREQGVQATELEVLRALSYDPGARRVLCACVADGGHEVLAGVGAIDLREGAEIDTLVTDETVAPGLAELLGAVLERLVTSRHRAA